MRIFYCLPLTIFFIGFFSSCTYLPDSAAPIPKSAETWQQTIIRHPFAWQNTFEKPDIQRIAPPWVEKKISQFITHLYVEGDFNVQIVGSEQNTLGLYGPREAVERVHIRIAGSQLLLSQTKGALIPLMRKVVVRVGLRQLHSLMQRGRGEITGLQVNSPYLQIVATPSAKGPIYLNGHMNLERLIQAGKGVINVIGIDNHHLFLKTTATSTGSVNLAGNINVFFISHEGLSEVNLIGVQQKPFRLLAKGRGKLGLMGNAIQLSAMQVNNYAQVYIEGIHTPRLKIRAYQSADIGISGVVGELQLETFGYATFQGHYLCVHKAYVRTFGDSHANLTSSGQVFVTAKGTSQVYFFGPAYLMTPFVSEGANIIPFDERNGCNYFSEYRPYSYTEIRHGKRVIYHQGGFRYFK